MHPSAPSRSTPLSDPLQRQIERLAGIGAWEFDPAARTLAWSDGMYRLHGVDPASFAPTLDSARALLAPASRDAFDAALHAAIDAGQAWDLELDLAGSPRWLRSMGEPQLQDGACVRVIGTMQEVTAQRTSLAALEADTRKLATVAQHTSNAVIIAGPDDRIEWVNASFTRITGYALEEVRGRKPRALLNRDDTESDPGFRAALGQWAAQQPVQGVTLKLYRKDGAPYWARVEVRRIHDERGAVTHHVHIHHDITAQREADEERRRLAEHLQAAVEAAGIGSVTRDLRTGEAIWDAGAFRIYGFPLAAKPPPADEVLGRFHPEDHARVEQYWRTLLQSGGARHDLEYRVVHPDGRIVHVHARGRIERDERGQPARVIGVVIDVTAQRLAEARARTATEWLALAGGATGIGFYYRDSASPVGVGDAQMRAIHGLSEDEPMPRMLELEELVVPEDRPRMQATQQRGDATGAPVEVDYRIRRRDGEVRWIRWRRVALPATADRPARIVAAVTDINDHVRAEQHRREYLERLQLAHEVGRVASWERNLETGAARWDPLLFAFHGLPVSDAVPALEEISRRVHPDDTAAFRSAWEQLRSSPDPVEFEVRTMLPDGTTRHLVTRARAEQRADGTPWRVIGATIDVTSSRQAAAALQSVVSRLQLATEAAGIGIWERNLVTGEARWDDTLFQLYGLRRGDGMPSRDLAVDMVHPDDRVTVEAAWERIQQVDHPVEFEYRVVRPDGSIAYMNTRGVAERNESGQPWRVFGATIDVTSKQAAQRQLREYIEWLRLAGEATGIGFFQVAIDGSFRRFDRQLRAMFGLESAAAALGESEFEAAVLEEDRPLLRAARQRALVADEPIEAEYRVRLPTGALRHIFTRRVRRCDDHGRPLYVIGTAVDVTHNRRAGEALQAAHDRLRLATQTARIGIWQRDLAHGALTWDVRMREIYGVDARWQPTPERWLALVHPDDRERFARRFGHSDDCDEPDRDEYRIVRPDGSVRHVVESHTVRRDESGAAAHVLGTNFDVTDARSAQHERDELYERMQLAAESIGLGVWDWDLLAESSAWSDQMYALFGRTREEFSGKTWKDFTHPDDVAYVGARLAEAIRATGRCDFEFRALQPDGRVRWLACRGRVQRDLVGTPVRVIGVNWDVTEKHVAEEALREKEAAERASRAKTEFLSRMSHELRTPLNAILGFAQVLELDRRQPLTDTQADRVDRIQKAGWHLLTLINEVLELARIEAGALTLTLAPVALPGLVKESIELIAPTAAERGIAIDLTLEADTPALVRADATRVRQVLLNLLSNAVKYNRDGGRIEVRIGRAADVATISVRDTGIGMSEAQLAQLFQPFNRLGVGDAIEGTGIGLTITRRLLELMRGGIEVTSNVGAGSEFTVRLPTEDETPAPALPAPARSAASAYAAATVLYVEDNRSNRELVREILTLRPGIRLLEAQTGEEGLHLAATTSLAFALVDMRLPDMDGIELRQRLLAAGRDDVPCIGLSANALAADRERALTAGFVDYWTKPIIATDFLLAIDRTLERLAAGQRI